VSGRRGARPAELALDRGQVVIACLEAVIEFGGGHVEAEGPVQRPDGCFFQRAEGPAVAGELAAVGINGLRGAVGAGESQLEGP
jgi:hypothetical protein